MQAADPRSAVRFGSYPRRLSAGFVTAAILAALSTAQPAAAAKKKHHHRVHQSLLKLRHAQVTPLSFAALNGWNDDDQAAAFKSFLNSCDAIRHATPAMRRKRPIYGGLYKACERALAAGTLDRAAARKFFEDNFKPVRIAPAGETEGFFTGYYEVEFSGSRFPSDKFSVPLYRVPKKLVGRSTVFGSYNRAKIEDGVLAGKGLEICWIKDPIDAFFAQIQGSARVRLDTGKVLRLNYIASNGKPYYPVGRDLIKRGIVAREDMTMDRIRDWMVANPEEGKELRRKNRSYVFFTETGLKADDDIEGAQGVPLTPLRSLAVDKHIHVYGTPIWVEAELPIRSEAPETPFDHLLIAQDTGSAIVGPARADIYFGHGEGVDHIAGRIKQHGRFVMLVPRDLGVKGDIDIPLPRPKPPALTPDGATTLAAAKKAMPLPKSRPQAEAQPQAETKADQQVQE
jgi:membrane-bound lytic murein transglycosylase A